MRRPIHILMATLGIAIIGAAAGALCAAVLLAADLGPAPGNFTREAIPYFVIVASFGAALGALVASAICWTFLRHVSRRLGLAWTTAGTLGGGAIGLVLVRTVPLLDNNELVTVGLPALAGAVGAAGLLRRRMMGERAP